MTSFKTLAATAMFIATAASAGISQTAQLEPDPAIGALQDGNAYLRNMMTRAAAQMSAEDYAFRPTPDVRSFGDILGHVADTNFFFCSAAKGEKPPVTRIEKTSTTRSEIEKILADSFEYCDQVYANIADLGNHTVELMGRQRAPSVVLMFRNYHALLHYGNIITYMRLRGKVPPSSQLPELR